MLKRLLSKKSKKKTSTSSSPTTLSTLDKLHETLEMLEKKEKLLQKKISIEVEKTKDLIKSKNKSAAIQCLKRKRLYESQIEQLGNFQLRIHDQIILLEGAKATTDTVDALRTGSSAVKTLQQSISIDEIEKTIENLAEYSENMKQIQDALASPVGAAAEIDEDELEAELEELSELEEEEEEREYEEEEQQLPMTPQTIPARAPTQSKNEVDQLTELQAEMAI